MKRFLSFMLGIIFGIVFLLGAYGIAVYSSVTVVHPNEIYADIETYLGDLGDVSLLQAYYNILDLYEKQTGNLTNGKLYSVGDFLADNHISSTTEEGETMAFGIIMPQELLDAPLFEYFNTNVDEDGHTGIQRALKQIKLSAVPAIVNTFATTGENGEPVISESVVAELDNHSVFDLVYGDTASGQTPNIVKNLSVIMENITLADLIPAFRAEGETDNIMKTLLFAVGETPIGELLTDLIGDENILGSLNEDGSLAAVGRLTIADILGDSDPLINSMLGNVSVGDFVNEDGDFTITEVLDGISIAGLVGLVKRTAQVEIADANITTYYETNEYGSRGALIWSVGKVDDKYYISLNAENDSVATTWWEGQLVCENAHEHEAICFDYLWYAPCTIEHDHAGEYTMTVDGEATPYAPVATTSVYYTVASINLGSLIDDTGAINLDNLITQFDEHSLDAIIDELLAHNEIFEKLSALLELDDMNLSDLLAEGGIDTLLSKVTDTPIARIMDVFGVEGMGIITDLVGDMSINQLIEGGYEDISLGSIIGLVKREMDIADANGDLPNGVVVRDFVSITDDTTVVELSVAKDGERYYLSTNYDKNADKLAGDYVAPVWYEGQLKCSVDAHIAFDNHEKDCFEYVLYQACAEEDVEHDHATEDAFSITTTQDDGDVTTYYVQANTLFSVLGNMTVGGLMEGGFNTLLDELTNIKLSELFEILGLEEMEGAFEALSELTIKELMEGGYNDLTLGSLLGYKRYQKDGAVDTGSIVTFKDGADNVVGYVAKIDQQTVLSADGETWYNGKLACEEEHTHDFDCYEHLWYSACPDGCLEDHEHVTIDERPHTLTTGIFALLVDLTIGDITNNPNSLIDKVFETKLGDLLDEDLEGLMATIAEYSVKDLMDPSTLNGIGLGDILNYIRNDVTEQATSASGWDVDIATNTEGTVIVKQNSTTGKYAYYDTADSKWYAGQMNCKKDVHTHADPNCTETGCELDEHIHNLDCYGYIWYAECTETNCNDHDEHITIDDKIYGNVDGIFGVLADLTIGDLTGGTDIMDTLTNRLTLGDIFGENIAEMLESLKDTPIADLSGVIESTKVGNLLGFKFNKDLQRWEKEVDGQMQPLKGIEKTIADRTINDLKDFSSILDEVTLGDVLDPVPEMLEALANVKIPDLAEKIETLQVGQLLGYEHLSVDVTTADWSEVAGITGLLQHTDGTLAEVADGEVFYVTELTCNDEGHEHNIDCYNYKWYDNCDDGCTGVDHPDHQHYTDIDGDYFLAVVGITSKIADKTINELKDFDSILDEVTLGDVLDPVPEMLIKLKDKPITSLGEEIDTLVVGDFLGYGHLSVDITAADWTAVAGITGLLQNSDGTFAEITADGKYYVAELTCDVEDHTHAEPECGTAGSWTCEIDEHAHGIDCYDYKWYDKCDDGCTGTDHPDDMHYADTDGNYFVAVVGIPSKLANKTINELSNLTDLMNDLTLNDVFGEGKVPGMLESIADEKIAKLESALNKIYVGDFLGYEQGEKILVCTITDPIHVHNDDLGDQNCCYQKKLACNDTSHTHSAMCYIYCYEWWQIACADNGHNHDFATTPECYEKVSGITGKIANERLDTLSDIGETIKTFTLSDVMGNDIPGMLQGIANTPIGELDDALENLYLGEILEYAKHPAVQSTIDDCTTTVATTVDGEVVVKTNAGKTSYIMLVDGVWYDAIISCAMADCTHTLADCYGYLWYDGEEQATGITAKLANERVSELGDLGDTIQSYSLYDVLGDNVPSMLDSIKYEPINNLDESINNVYVGEFLGYEQGEKLLVCTETDPAHVHNDDLGDPNCCYERERDCSDEMHIHSAMCYYYAYSWTHDGDTVDGMMAKIANKKVGNLGTIGDDIETFTFAEIMGRNDDDNAIIKELYDTKVGDIGSKMDTMMLGTAMGYYRKTVCDESHSHVDACYETDTNGDFVWYQESGCTTPVGAPQSAFVNSKLQDIDKDISDIKLGELVDVQDGSSSMLKALKDTPIDGIADAIDGMALGSSMGFVRREIADTSGFGELVSEGENIVVKSNGVDYVKMHDGVWCEAILSCAKGHEHDADCYGYVWYEKCKLDEHVHSVSCAELCTFEEHLHATDIVIDGANHKKVGGLNAKMSNLTVGNMDGKAVVDVVTNLSMRDMMDSGILTFSEEEKFKLSILFGCDNAEHKVTYMFTNFQCDLAGYFAYNATLSAAGQSTLDTEQFYRKTHGIADGVTLTSEQLAHRDLWQDCTLTEFIETLLENFY